MDPQRAAPGSRALPGTCRSMRYVTINRSFHRGHRNILFSLKNVVVFLSIYAILPLRYLMAGTVPLHRLAQIMSHDSLDTTMLYVQGTKEDLQQAVETIAWT